MVVAGLLVAVTYDQAAATSQGRQQVRAALIEDIQRSSDAGDELTAELEELRVEVARTRDELLAASVVGQRALDEVAAAEEGAAAVPVTGPGLLVTLANAESDADDDPVGGNTDGGRERQGPRRRPAARGQRAVGGRRRGDQHQRPAARRHHAPSGSPARRCSSTSGR